MSRLKDVADFWDAEIARWVEGDPHLHPDLERWRRGYRGRGAGAVDMSVMPEPYVGPLAIREPAVVMMGLNPGLPAPEFQALDGIYTRRVRETSYSQWAAEGPYTDADWESRRGANRYHRSRATFARRLLGNDSIEAKDILHLELYPFHSQSVTAPMLPPADLLQRYILEPLGELATPLVFAFGKPWIDAAGQLGLGVGDELPVRWSTPSRRALRYPLTSEQSLIVLVQNGYAGPPGQPDTSALAGVLHSEFGEWFAGGSTATVLLDSLAEVVHWHVGNSWGISYFEERQRYRETSGDGARLRRADGEVLRTLGTDPARLVRFARSKPGYYYGRAVLFEEGHGHLSRELIGRYGDSAPVAFLNLFLEEERSAG